VWLPTSKSGWPGDELVVRRPLTGAIRSTGSATLRGGHACPDLSVSVRRDRGRFTTVLHRPLNLGPVHLSVVVLHDLRALLVTGEQTLTPRPLAQVSVKADQRGNGQDDHEGQDERPYHGLFALHTDLLSLTVRSLQPPVKEGVA
jgi:hypothetical protein